jgi:3-methyladenine DNA glycosylase AlkD
MNKDTSTFVADIQAALIPLTDAERAVGMKRYMKDQFTYLGIPSPIRRAAVNPLLKNQAENAVPLAEALWQLPEREYHYTACDLLRRHAGHLQPRDLPRLEALVITHSWWDTVDSLAPSIGEMVRHHPELASRMDELIMHENMWLRRVAILHQLNWKHETNRDRLFAYCLHCAPEQEFFIRKAIGWALRQYARTDPEAIRDFVNSHRAELSGRSVREALKHL